MRKRRILITGASGLLGLNTALEIAGEHTVFGQVNNNSLHTDLFTVCQTDLLAPGAVERLLDQTQPDWVIHCAAQANIDACETDPARAHQLNSEIPRLLAEHVARGGARLIQVSTDAVFDGRSGGYSETDRPNPLSVYAHSKLNGERLVAEANPDAIIARVNIFGWSLIGKRSLAEFFYNHLTSGRIAKGFNNVYFCPILVNDLAGIFLEMFEKGLSGIYHTVGSQCLSKYEFGLQVARCFHLDERLVIPTEVQDSGLKAARSPNLTLKVDKITRDLGRPIPSYSTGLERFYTLYQQGYPQKLSSMRSKG